MRKHYRIYIGCVFIGLVIVGASLPEIAPLHDPTAYDWANALQGPTSSNWLGTDEFGRDVFVRLLHGSRATLGIGVGATLFGGLVGTIIGLLAGFYRGSLDGFLMRIIDILMSFPGVLLAITVAAVLGAGIVNIIIAVGVYAVPVFARIVRSVVLTIREQAFVEAARALGGRDIRLLVKHALPNTVSPLLITTSVTISTSILVAASLSFLGLGAPPGSSEWGVMISQGREYLSIAPHLVYFPGLAIILAATGFNILGDGLRDLFDVAGR